MDFAQKEKKKENNRMVKKYSNNNKKRGRVDEINTETRLTLYHNKSSTNCVC